MSYIKTIDLMAKEVTRVIVNTEDKNTLKGHLKSCCGVITNMVLTDATIQNTTLLQLYNIAVEVVQGYVLEYWNNYIKSYNKQFYISINKYSLYNSLIVAFNNFLSQ